MQVFNITATRHGIRQTTVMHGCTNVTLTLLVHDLLGLGYGIEVERIDNIRTDAALDRRSATAA